MYNHQTSPIIRQVHFSEGLTIRHVPLYIMSKYQKYLFIRHVWLSHLSGVNIRLVPISDRTINHKVHSIQGWGSQNRRVSITVIPLHFWVSISVSIKGLTFSKSRSRSWLHDWHFQSLDLDLEKGIGILKVSISISIYKFRSRSSLKTQAGLKDLTSSTHCGA